MPNSLARATDTGDKLHGIEILKLAGFPTPPTMPLDSTPERFPEFGVDSVIFRPSLTESFDAEAVQATSGLVDSLIVHRFDWPGRRSAVRRMVETWPTIVQPFIAQSAGAIAHYWSAESTLRIAMAESTARIAEGHDADVSGRLFLMDDRFTTGERELAPQYRQLVEAVRSLTSLFPRLPSITCWELEMCLDSSGGITFLQAQPSTARFIDGWV